MIRPLATLALLTAAGAAWGQDLTLHPTWVLEGEDGSFTQQGVGKPSVVWDGTRFVMYFDTWSNEDPGDCEGDRPLHSIGRATSTDGVEWQLHPSPVLSPGASSLTTCGMSDPAVVYHDKTWHLFFKAWTDQAVAQPGIGHATSSDGVTFTVDPSLAVSFSDWGEWTDMGHPSVVLFADEDDRDWTWSMWLSRLKTDGTGDILLATSQDGGATWSTRDKPVLKPGTFEWYANRVRSPAAECDPSESYPYLLYFGGEADESQSLGVGTSKTGDDWYADPDALLTWTSEREWTEIDALRLGDDTLVWFVDPAPDGTDRIGMAYTSGPGWDGSLANNRVCGQPAGSDSGDTGDSGDTDDTGPFIPGDYWISGGWGCWRDRHRPDSAWVFLFLGLPLLGAGLRRRSR